MIHRCISPETDCRPGSVSRNPTEGLKGDDSRQEDQGAIKKASRLAEDEQAGRKRYMESGRWHCLRHIRKS